MASRTYINLDATKAWIQDLGFSRWNLYELGDGRESAIMEHKGDTIEDSIARLDSVVNGTSKFNKGTKYKIVVFKNENPNSTKYEKYFTLDGYTDAPAEKEDKAKPLSGFGGVDSTMFTFLTQIGEVKGQSQAKEAFISYREEQLIRRETLMDVKEKDLEDKYKAKEKELKAEIEGLKKKYEDNVDAAKNGFSMALIEGIKTFTGMGTASNGSSIGALDSGLTDVQKRVLALSKDKQWTDAQWQDVGNMISSIPADLFHQYFLALCAFYKQAGTDAGKVQFLTTQIPTIAIP